MQPAYKEPRTPSPASGRSQSKAARQCVPRTTTSRSAGIDGVSPIDSTTSECLGGSNVEVQVHRMIQFFNHRTHGAEIPGMPGCFGPNWEHRVHFLKRP